MAYTWPQGSTHIQLPVTLQQNDGSYYDLTGVNPSQIAFWMRTVIGNVRGTLKLLTGSVQTIQAPYTNGTFTFKFSPADVANVGTFEVVVVITYGANDVSRTLPVPFVIADSE